MNPRLIDLLVCPACRGDLTLDGPHPAPADTGEVEAGVLRCAAGHRWPVQDGVPRLGPTEARAGGGAARSIRESFSREWAYFDYDRDRTWGASARERREEFLRHVALPAGALRGRVVLDAGCGNGTLSNAIATLGCEVVAADIGSQVVHAHRRLGGPRETGALHFAQADLMRPPFRPGAFDVVFCAGVLHHTPDTRGTFELLMPALAPGGTIFVWLYHHVPGRLLAVKARLRRVLSRLPAPVKSGVVVVGLLPQAMVRQQIRVLRGRCEPRDRLSWRERLVVLLDSYTPRYRWEHTPEELSAWYREHGLEDVQVTELGPWGFGVAARRPQAVAEAPPPAVAAAA